VVFASTKTFCVVNSSLPGFAPLLVPLDWVTPKFKLIYCKISDFKIKEKKEKKKVSYKGIEPRMFLPRFNSMSNAIPM